MAFVTGKCLLVHKEANSTSEVTGHHGSVKKLTNRAIKTLIWLRTETIPAFGVTWLAQVG